MKKNKVLGRYRQSLVSAFLLPVFLLTTIALPVSATPPGTMAPPNLLPVKSAVPRATTTNTYTISAGCNAPYVLQQNFMTGDQIAISAYAANMESGELLSMNLLGPSGFTQVVPGDAVTHTFNVTVTVNDRPLSACMTEDNGDSDDPDQSGTVTVSVTPSQVAKPVITLDSPGAFTVDGNIVPLQFHVSCPSAGGCDGVMSITPIRFDSPTREGLVAFNGGWSSAAPPIAPLAYNGTSSPRWNWDSSGMAWTDAAVRVPQITLGAIVYYATLGSDPLPFSAIAINTKPVILVHGCCGGKGSNTSGLEPWNEFRSFFLAAKFTPNYATFGANGSGYSVNNMDMTFSDTGQLIETNEMALQKTIADVMNNTKAEQVDIVAHSMGGLVSRYYIAKFMGTSHGRPIVHRLVMLGTPNTGSLCYLETPPNQLLQNIQANIVHLQSLDVLWFVRKTHVPYPAQQLDPKYVQHQFNPSNSNKKGVPFINIVGTKPFYGVYTCARNANPLLLFYGDGAVSTESATAYGDVVKQVYLNHIELLKSQESFNNVKPYLTLGPDQATQAPHEVAVPNAQPAAPRVNPTAISEVTPQVVYKNTLQLPANSTSSIGFFSPAASGTLDVTLLLPPTVDGALYNPQSQPKDALPPQGTFTDETPYTLSAAQSGGQWSLSLTNHSAAALSIPIVVDVENDDFIFTITQLQQRPGSLIISATSTYQGHPTDVIGAQVSLQGDNGSYLRADLVHTGTGTYTYAADYNYLGTGLFTVVLDTSFVAPRTTIGTISLTGATIDRIQFDAPGISPYLPIGGPTSGGTPIKITGVGFSPYTEVYLDDLPAYGVSVNANGTEITAITPSHVTEQAQITLLLPDGTITSWQDYAFVAPQPVARQPGTVIPGPISPHSGLMSNSTAPAVQPAGKPNGPGSNAMLTPTGAGAKPVGVTATPNAQPSRH